MSPCSAGEVTDNARGNLVRRYVVTACFKSGLQPCEPLRISGGRLRGKLTRKVRDLNLVAVARRLLKTFPLNGFRIDWRRLLERLRQV
jgi:hypothetical protein